MGGYVSSRADIVKQYKNSEKMEEKSEISQEAEQDALYHRQEIQLTPWNKENQEDPGKSF